MSEAAESSEQSYQEQAGTAPEAKALPAEGSGAANGAWHVTGGKRESPRSSRAFCSARWLGLSAFLTAGYRL